ncbi:MAG TPA: PKD domain-containing protein, partial [Lacipirellulaceae bacterium]|nr:PKD domain-containing protein [Lacipirellulaceae bacterium]
MRLSWLTALRPGQLRNPLRGVGRRRRGPKTVPLRVRQLERRRVLDGAIQSAVVSTLLTDVGQSSQTANSNPSPATGSQSNVQAPSANSASGNTAYSAAIAQGSILNIPPVLVVATDQTSHEGQLLDLSGTGGAPPLGLFVDPDLGDSHTATVNWGDSLAIENATIIGGVGAGALGGTHTYADDGVYTVTVKVFDNNGGSDTKSFNVMVQNVPPVLVTAPDQTVAEGHLLDLSGTGGAPPLGLFVDPGLLDTHTATVNWGDGSTTENATIIPGVGAGALGGTHKYAEDGTYTVTVKVMDNDGGSDTRTFDVTVKDVTPGVALNPVPDINENGIVTLTGTYTDPGIQDSQTLTVHWDDPNKSSASTFAIGAIQNSAGMSTLSVGQLFNSSTDSAVLTITSINSSTGDVGFSVQHRYLDDGLAPGNGTISDTSTVMVTVKDDDGQTGSSTTMVTVSNVTPSVVLNAVSDINENGFATLLGSFTDIGLLDAHTLIINWADPNNASASTFTISAIENAAEMATLHVGDTFASSTDSVVLKITSIDTLTGQVGFTSQHQYLDDGLAPGNGTVSDISTIGVSVTDDDTQAGSNTTMVAIHNVAPSIVVGPVSDINENGVATLTGNYTDIGLLDAHTLTINWDDPNNASASTFTINAVENAAGTATLHFGDTFSSSTDNAVLTIESINSATGEVGFSVKHQYLDDGLAPGNNTTSDTSTISATVAD